MFEPRDTASAQTPRPAARAATGEVHVLDRLSAVYRHRRLVISTFLLALTLFMLQSYATVPQYRAQGRLLIDDERTVAIRGMDSNDPIFWQDPEPYYETQYRILQSRGLTQQTVRGLALDSVPEFTGQGPEQFGPLEALRSARSAAVAAIGTAASTVVSWLRAEDAARDGDLADGDLDAADASATESRNIAGFIARLAVTPVVNTRLVDVSFRAADPEFAAEALNAHLATYVEQNLARRLENTSRQLAWLGDELGKQQGSVEDSERALSDYRRDQNALSLGDNQNIVGQRLTELNSQVTRAESARLQQETLFNQIRDLDPNSDAAGTFPAVSGHPDVQTAEGDLAELQAEQARLAGRYLPLHPTMVKLTASLENAERALSAARARAVESIRAGYEAALGDENRLKAQLRAQEAAVQELGRKSVGYAVLERTAESNRRIYESLLQQQKELQVVANSRANNVQLMDRAEVPGAPFTPNTRRDWFLGIMAGLLLAFGLVVVIEYLDDTIKTPDDVARRLRVPLLGLVPAVRGHRVPVLSGAVPHDFGEAFRSLRTSLVFTGANSGTRIVGITSTQPLEGKTTCACNTAMVLALGGARVLLIDGDMRRPSLHKSLGMANSTGLSHVLAGQARIREAIQRTHDPNLFALAAGQPPPNPSELLSSERMRSFLTSLESGPFDWVIIDTPPVLAVTDAVIIAPLVSAMVFVVGAEMTRSGHAERALELLAGGDNAAVVGVVLNRVDFDRNKYYYSRYYGYHYKSYYGESPAAA